MVQWLRIHLPKQGTQVQSAAEEDSICFGTTKPVSQLLSACSRVHVLQLLKPPLLGGSETRKASTMRSPCTATRSSPHLLQLEKAHATNTYAV